MKYLKSFKLLESKKYDLDINDIEENFLEFQDIGFDIFISDDETDCDFKIIGSIKNKPMPINKLIREYDTTINRLSDIGIVLFSKTFFNYITNNYNFEIRVSSNVSDREFIKITHTKLSNKQIIEFTPTRAYYKEEGVGDNKNMTLIINGKNINGGNELLTLYYINKDDQNKKMITLYRKSMGNTISKEDLSKLEVMLMDDSIVFNLDKSIISNFLDLFI